MAVVDEGAGAASGSRDGYVAGPAKPGHEPLDTARPHPARMYDYWLGGRDNYEVDREAAERIISFAPIIRGAVRANRAFMRRAVRCLVEDCGVRQIIDIGTGIPTSPNTHEIAHALAPDTVVAYVDNDPIVAVHAQARLTGSGGTAFVAADAREPAAILEHPTVRGLIDFGRPVAVLMIAVLHFVTDAEGPGRIVGAVRDALPAGSFLALTHGTADFVRTDIDEAARVYRDATASLNLRPYAAVESLFTGFELLEPGLVPVTTWRADPLNGAHGAAGAENDDDLRGGDPRRFGMYGGVARKV